MSDNFDIDRGGQIFRRRGSEGLLRTEKTQQLARINWILKELGIERPDKIDIRRIAKILLLSHKYDDFIKGK